MNKLEENPSLGAVSGILITDGKPEIFPSDEIPNIRVYRKSALECIGGFPKTKYSQDSVILAKLRLAKYQIKSFPEVRIINLRNGERSIKNQWETAVTFGKARRYLGYSRLLFLLGTGYSTLHNGPVFGLGLMVGYLSSTLNRDECTDDNRIYYYYQNERLGELI